MTSTWTKEKPIVEGWYWWHRKPYDPAIVLLKACWGILYVMNDSLDETCVDKLDGQWSSEPIEEPKNG